MLDNLHIVYTLQNDKFLIFQQLFDIITAYIGFSFWNNIKQPLYINIFEVFLQKLTLVRGL